MAHNMMAFMLDPRYKGLKCVANLIRKDRTHVLVEEYEKKKLVPLLVVVFKSFYPCYPQTPLPNPLVLDDLLFGESTSIEEGLLKSKLFLFCQIVVSKEDLKSPLAWWKTHESQFPDVGFLARQILGIPRS
jgi:hypothetical protein